MNRVDEACDFESMPVALAAKPATGKGYLGVDSGKEGYLALISADLTTILEHYATPLRVDGSYDLPAMLAILRRLAGRVLLAVLEEQIAMPEQDPRSTMTIGKGVGHWEALLVATGIPYETEDPNSWKGEMDCLAPRAKAGSRPKPPTEYAHLSSKELRRSAGTLRRRMKDEDYKPLPHEQALIDWLKTNGDRSSARKKQAKALSEGLATRLFPGYDFRASERCKTLHDGKCESALLGVFAGRRHLGGCGK